MEIKNSTNLSINPIYGILLEKLRKYYKYAKKSCKITNNNGGKFKFIFTNK